MSKESVALLLAVVLDVELMRGASESTADVEAESEEVMVMVTSGTARPQRCVRTMVEVG